MTAGVLLANPAVSAICRPCLLTTQTADGKSTNRLITKTPGDLTPDAKSCQNSGEVFSTQKLPSFDPLNQSFKVHYNLDDLPQLVKTKFDQLMTLASSGDIKGLLDLAQADNLLTSVSYLENGQSSQQVLASLVKDSDGGEEFLAILTEVLESGYIATRIKAKEVKLELYTWPYFAVWPIAKLNKAQRIKLLKLITSDDLNEMRGANKYTFLRTGILSDGRWCFLTIGS